MSVAGFREQRSLEEEQGRDTLYLALGFLNWFDSVRDQTLEFAPQSHFGFSNFRFCIVKPTRDSFVIN
jgi:Protein of unknown function (DUF4011)